MIRSCFAIALLVVSLEPVIGQAVVSKDKFVPEELGESWMTSLSDAKSLASLSIPGSHNTCAMYGGIYGKCQDLPLKAQLNAGVRFLDIRCRLVNDKFQIYHGPLDQRISFDQVRATCADFLKNNPGECLVMSVREEAAPVTSTLGFGEVFKRYLAEDEALWSCGESVPILGRVRGEIVVVSRHADIPGIPWAKQPVQDVFKVNDPNLKWQKVQNHFFAVEEESVQLSINFCSGTGILCPPRSLAKTINTRLLAELKKDPARHLGVVVMDFPNKELIRTVFARNASAIAD